MCFLLPQFPVMCLFHVTQTKLLCFLSLSGLLFVLCPQLKFRLVPLQ